MINITLLGTAGMVPTKDRNVTSIYLEYKGEGILFDCGEGAQRQMNIAGINRNKVRKIFISHWHGDHVGGILGLLQTISNVRSGEPISMDIFGPKETKKRFQHILDTSYFDISGLKITVHEFDISSLTKIHDSPFYFIEAIPLDHHIPCLGYNFIEKDRLRINVSAVSALGIPSGPILGKLQNGRDIEFKGKKYTCKDLTYSVKGKKVSFLMDTSYTKNAIILAKDADILFSEATFLDKDIEKAEQYKHLSIKQASSIAHAADVKKLVLFHFSQRYKNIKDLEEEAKSIFPSTYVGYDLMKIKI
jgi:ribonuclease Z